MTAVRIRGLVYKLGRQGRWIPAEIYVLEMDHTGICVPVWDMLRYSHVCLNLFALAAHVEVRGWRWKPSSIASSLFIIIITIIISMMMIQGLSLNLSAGLTSEQVLWDLPALPCSIVVTELCLYSQLLCDSSESEPKPTCLHSRLFIYWAITPSPHNKKFYEFKRIYQLHVFRKIIII